MLKIINILGLLAAVFPFVTAQTTWCGKNYRKTTSSMNPGGQFVEPATSPSTLLNFRCWPRVQPYLAGEGSGQIIIDAGLTNLEIPGAQTFNGEVGSFTVRVTTVVGGSSVSLATGLVPVGSTGHLLPFDPSVLPASMTPATITCTATLGTSTYSTTGKISKLPIPLQGSVTKQDYLTGALLVNTTSNLAGAYKPIIPFGFYTGFSNYLALNPVTIVDNAKTSGRNLIHVVPPFLNNEPVFQTVLNEMEKQGMYLMYDMRDDFQNLTAVQSQVNMFKNYPNLLLWYTADEPDGWSYPQNSTLAAGNLINQLDPYHPVSLVLNCYDYFFEPYTQGATILMHDPYPIGINATFSPVWGTVCNSTYGDCGCDDCNGNFGDLTTRADIFTHRLSVDGRSRGYSAWSVPQAFGVETYWPREPTPNEFILETVITLNHGSRGIVPWTEDQTMPANLKSSASVLGGALSTIETFVFADGVAFQATPAATPTGVDVAQWTVGTQTLILGGNMGTSNVTVSVGTFGTGATAQTIMSLGGTASISAAGALTLSFSSLGSIGLVVTRV